MICRMTKEQRDALIDLMNEIVQNSIGAERYRGRYDLHISEAIFHKLFANEDQSHDEFKITGNVEATFAEDPLERSVVTDINVLLPTPASIPADGALTSIRMYTSNGEIDYPVRVYDSTGFRADGKVHAGETILVHMPDKGDSFVKVQVCL